MDQDTKSNMVQKKPKITIVGSNIDMDYYQHVSPWIMDKQKVKVVENNDHLGQIISGTRQIQKNVDESLKRGRNSLFGLLGPAFAFKCLLSPLVKIHLFRTYTCPRLRSGLSSLALRQCHLSTLALFHRKSLKGFLHLSKCAPTPAIHFLLGELPLEGKIHRDMLSLFYGVWSNPDTKVYHIVKYLLSTSSENSTTWAINLRHICKMYGLEDPLTSLSKNPPSKNTYKEVIMTKISAFHEKELKNQALKNSQMVYLNVNLSSLRGKSHPCLSNVITSHEVKKLRPHLKFLSGDYLTYQTRFQRTQKGSPLCKICESENETISHILAICPQYNEVRRRIFSQISAVSKLSKTQLNINLIIQNPEHFTQFILDPTSFNLENRVHRDDPIVQVLFKLSRDMCYSIHNARMKKLKELFEK